MIAGKSILAFKRDQEGKQELSGRCFAWVQTYDEKPKRRLCELLKRQGMQPNQQVDFLSDGGEDMHNAAAFESKNEHSQKLLKGVGELHTYVKRNKEFVPNYGERYRNEERIATGFVESAINQVAKS